MRYAMIMAGGSGTRLWPMSTAGQPKQLIPFIGGKSLLQRALDRLEGLVPADRRYICAGEAHRELILKQIDGIDADRYLAEPTGRDTLNAVGFAAAALLGDDPDAVIAVFTADHLIQPVDEFQKTVEAGYQLAEQQPESLVTFGIRPAYPETGYGYLQLGDPIGGDFHGARVVDQFKEKPDADTAQQYFDAGPERYLWNSGMFVWRAETLMRCIEKYRPENYEGLKRIGAAWHDENRETVLHEVYPDLPKISVDFGVMEPASHDEAIQVATVPMNVQWLDVGSWPAYAETCETDEAGNAVGCEKALLLETKNTLVASEEPDHLIATLGVEDLVVVHTARATLVCAREHAQRIKELHAEVKNRHGEEYV